MPACYNINNLIQEGQSRWLKAAEVLFILENHEQSQQLQITEEPLQKPASGSLILVNKRVLKLFRNDGHNWRKKKGGKVVSEGHEKLKVENSEVLINCYYGHGGQNPDFQRRIYWRLDAAFEHIVLVHYRDVTPPNTYPRFLEESEEPASSDVSLIPNSAPSNVNLIPSSNTTQSPGASVSVTLISSSHTIPNPGASYSVSLIKSSETIPSPVASASVSLFPNSDSGPNPGVSSSVCLTPSSHTVQNPGTSSSQNPVSSRNSISSNQDLCKASQTLSNLLTGEFSPGFLQSLALPILELFDTAASILVQHGVSPHSLKDTEKEPHNTDGILNPEAFAFPGFGDHSSNFELQQDVSYLSLIKIGEKQIFRIQDIVPDWGYADEKTMVIIVGTFLCDWPWQSEALYCMFGETEVPVRIIQGTGLIVCHAPRHCPGKVPLYITSGNREASSEVREFDYRQRNENSTITTQAIRLISELLADVSSPPSGGGLQLSEMDDNNRS